MDSHRDTDIAKPRGSAESHVPLWSDREEHDLNRRAAKVLTHLDLWRALSPVLRRVS